MMQLVDSHTHLESFQLDGELIEVLERAEKSGVGRLVTVGTGLSDWGLYRRLAAEHPGVVFYTAGIHPSGMRADWEREFERLEPDFFNSEVRQVAVGEIGLDRFHLDEDPAVAEEEFARQRQAFRLQL